MLAPVAVLGVSETLSSRACCGVLKATSGPTEDAKVVRSGVCMVPASSRTSVRW